MSGTNRKMPWREGFEIRGNGEAKSGPLRSQTRLKIYGTNLVSRAFRLPLIAGILKESATYGNNFTLKVRRT